MHVHLIDGTYELFRHFFAVPPRRDAHGEEAGALLGVARSVVAMIRDGATHLGVATDHVVESFRNDLYAGYKTGDGIDPVLWRQFHPLEELLRAIGVRVWPMVEQEADDALAAAASRARLAPGVDRIFICSPDKDLAQCVRGDQVVQFDRRNRVIRQESDIIEKFGVPPVSIPDYLALVGDAADGFPGVPRWGAKSAAGVLACYGGIERIPRDAADWQVRVRGASALAASLVGHWEEALLFRELATLRTDAEVFDDVEELRWRGPKPELGHLCRQLAAADLADEVAQLVR